MPVYHWCEREADRLQALGEHMSMKADKHVGQAMNCALLCSLLTGQAIHFFPLPRLRSLTGVASSDSLPEMCSRTWQPPYPALVNKTQKLCSRGQEAHGTEHHLCGSPDKLLHLIERLGTHLWHSHLDTDSLISPFIWHRHVISI